MHMHTLLACAIVVTREVSALENEIRALKHANEEKQASLTAVQKKNSALEVEIIETHQRAQQLSARRRSETRGWLIGSPATGNHGRLLAPLFGALAGGVAGFSSCCR